MGLRLDRKVEGRFECKRCGACCKGRDVPLALDDILRLSEFMGMDPDSFFTEYCVEMATERNAIALPFIRRNGESCPFLDGSICRVHFVKPAACEHMPSAVFGSLERLREMMPPTCAIQHTVPDNDDRSRKGYIASMMITAIYYSKYGTFRFRLARPFIYKILLFKHNRNSIRKFVGREVLQN